MHGLFGDVAGSEMSLSQLAEKPSFMAERLGDCHIHRPCAAQLARAPGKLPSLQALGHPE